MSARNLLNKKVIIVTAVLTVGALFAVLLVSSSSIVPATAQERQQKMNMNMMTWSDEETKKMILPQINGTVNVANETSNFINENARVSFVEAAEIVQGQVSENEKVIAGHLGVIQGYLVYTFFVANTANQTGYLTIVDAGNGEVLYTSEGHPFGSFGGYMHGQWGGGYGDRGGWHGPWKGHGWGFWH